LLPPQWQRYLPNIETTVPRIRGRSELLPLRILCTNNGWIPSARRFAGSGEGLKLPIQTPIELAASITTEVLANHETGPDYMDLPILSSRLQDPQSVELIPFLTTTWAILKTNYGSLENIAAVLGTGSVLEFYQTTGSISATLDVAITTPSWCERTSSGLNKVLDPEMPETLSDAYLLAGVRHLRTAGVDPKRTHPDSPWATALSIRAKVFPGSNGSYRAAADSLGNTAEAVRRICIGYPLRHTLRRQWPLAGQLAELNDLLSNAEGSTSKELTEQISSAFPEETPLTLEQAADLLSRYGHTVDLATDASGILRNVGVSAGPKEMPSLEKIGKMAWDISSGTGFIRRPDLQQEILLEYPNLSIEDCSSLIDAAFRGQRLPMGYLYAAWGTSNTVTGTFNRMLSWTSPLHVSELREGLTRRFRFRQLPVVPPVPVITALIEYLSGFEISNGFVTPVKPQTRNMTTIIGWIGALLEESQHGTLHRSAILNATRNANLKQASVATYLSFGENIKPVGRGCYSLVGCSPTSHDIEAARHDSSLIHVQDKILSTEIVGTNAYMTITVGTAMRDSGNITPNAQTRRFIADRQFSVKSHLGTHGKVSLSNGTIFYGFSSVMNALGVIPGDQITINLDFENSIAHIELLLDEG
jgi:hypothetical protein